MMNFLKKFEKLTNLEKYFLPRKMKKRKIF